MRVFISSTYLDNRQRRAIVEDAVLRAEMIPIGMERFPASAAPTVDDCLRRVRSCDVFVGIVAERYGWIPDGHDVSISELEYDAAKEIHLPRLIFEIASAGEAPAPSDHPKKLDAFRAKLRADQTPARCAEGELGVAVLQSLQSLRGQRADSWGTAPLEPWQRDLVGELHRLQCAACEELDRSASILGNLPLTTSRAEAERREDAARRLREIGVQLRNVRDASDLLRQYLDEMGVAAAASMREAGSIFICLSNNTTLGHHPTPEDQRAEEAENRSARDEARRLLACPRA